MFKRIGFIALLAVFALGAVSCNDNRTDSKSSGDSTVSSAETTESTQITTATGQIYVAVTGDDGKAVTDNEGNAVTTAQPVIITQIPGTTYVTVTDSKGEAVTGANGEVVTSEQTIWVTTMQTVSPDKPDVTTLKPNDTTTYSKTQTTVKTTTTATKKSTSATLASTSVSTTTAHSSQGDNSQTDSSDFAYGALSTVVIDLVEATDDGDFINLVFNVKDDANGIYAVNIYDLMIANIDLETVEYITANGCVSVGSGIQTDVPTGGSPTVYVESVEGFAGEQIIVPVKIKNNSGVCAFDFKVQYDSSGLELVGMEKGTVVDKDSWTWIVNTEYTPR